MLHSEKLVTSVAEVLQEDYLNTFTLLLDAKQLYNISFFFFFLVTLFIFGFFIRSLPCGS